MHKTIFLMSLHTYSTTGAYTSIRRRGESFRIRLTSQSTSNYVLYYLYVVTFPLHHNLYVIPRSMQSLSILGIPWTHTQPGRPSSLTSPTPSSNISQTTPKATHFLITLPPTSYPRGVITWGPWARAANC